MKKTFCLVLATLAATVSFAAPRKAADITVAGYTGSAPLENFPVLVRISPERISGFSYADCAAGGADVAFTDAQGNALDREIDTWDTAGESLVWVRVPSLAAGTVITMTYGDSAVTAQPACQTDGSVWTPAGYVGVWHMNAASPADASASGNNGTAGGSAAVNPAGKVGSALSVPGVGDYVTCGQHLANSVIAAAFSVEGWACQPNYSGSQALFGKNLFVSIRTASASQITVTTPGKKDHNLTGLVLPAAGTWYHFALTFKKSTSAGCKLYLNGAFAKSDSAGDINDQTNPTEMWLGRNQWGNDQGLKGQLDEMRLAKVIHSADWIAASYATQANASFLTYSAASNLAGDSILNILGAPAELGSPTPAYGAVENLAANDPVALSMAVTAVPGEGTVTNYLAGWKLEAVNADTGARTLLRTSADAGEAIDHCAYVHASYAEFTWLWDVRDGLGVGAPALVANGGNSLTLSTDVAGIGYTAPSATLKFVYGVSPDALVYTNVVSASVTEIGDVQGTLTRLTPGVAYYVKAVLETNEETPAVAESAVVCVQAAAAEEGDPGLWQTFFTSANAVWTKDIWAVPAGTDWRNYTDANRIRRRELTPIGAYVGGNPGVTKYTSEVWGDQVYWPVNGGQWVYAGVIWLDAAKTYKFRMYIDDNERIQITDARTGATTTLLEDTASKKEVKTSASYAPSATGWHTIEIRMSDGSGGAGGYDTGSSYRNSTNLGFSQDNGATWALLLDPGDGSLLRAPDAKAITATENIADGALASVSLAFFAVDTARTLYAAWGPAHGGSDPADWLATNAVATVAAGATSATWTPPADWGSDTNLVVRFYFDGAFTEWSNAIFWHDYSSPSVTDLAADGTGGDTLVVSGTLASFPGESCTLSVFTGDSPTTLTNAWTGLAGSVRTATGDFSLTLFEPDTSAARYLTPGSTHYVVVEAAANGLVTRTAPVPVTMLAAPATFATPTAAINRRAATFSGRLATLGMGNAANVSVWYGTANDAATFVPLDGASTDVADTAAFSVAGEFPAVGTTYYWQFRAVNMSLGDTACVTGRSAIVTSATTDKTTYTWKAKDGVWDGDWADPDHWDSPPDSLGYPQTSAATAIFPGGHAIVVTNAAARSVGILDLTADNVDVTFKGGPDGTNVVLSVSTFRPRGVNMKAVLDGAYLEVANDFSFGPGDLVLTNAAYFHASGKTYHEAGGLIHLRGHSYMNLSYMRMSNSGTRLVIDDSTLYLRDNLEYAETNTSSYGGRTTFRGAAPLLLFASGKRPNMRVNGATATDWVFEIPSGGYASAPVRTANATVDFPDKYNNGRLRFTVSDDSPCFGDVATFDTPLVAWNGTKSILTAHVTTNAIAGPDSADCGFLYGTGATADAYGWAAMGAFSGTAKAVGVHIATSAHDDRVTVSTDNGAAVTGCSPAYGVHDGYAAGTAYTFTAPAAETVDGVRYKATGCTVTTYAAGSLSTVASVAEHAGATLEYEFAGQPVEIVWHFALDYPVAATAVNDAGGAVALSGDGHMSASSPVTLTASTATDGMEFQYWYGDVPYDHRFDNPLTLAADKAAEVCAFFGATAANGAARLSSGDNAAVNWFSTATWTGGVIPGTNDTAVLVGTYEAGSVNQGASGRRVFAPSYIGVGNLVVTNAILLVNVPTSSSFTRDTADGYGNNAYAPLGASDKVRTEPVGLDVFGDVLLQNRNKAKNNNAGCIFVGGSGQKANSRVFIGGDLAISNGCLFVSAGVVPDYNAFNPLKSGTGPSYFADYTNRVELYKGGNWVKVAGRTTLATPTTVNYQNMLQVANDYVTGAAVHLDLGDVYVGEGAAITAWASGYGRYTYNGKTYTMCPGGSSLGDNTSGGSHGGLGGTSTENSAAFTDLVATYDSEVAPIYPGSPVPGNGNRGGGTIRLDCGVLVLDGRLNAHGTRGWGNKGGSAGGAIWVNCASFVPGENCMVSVRGGTWGSDSNAGGGGGRASICVGLTDGQMDGLFANDAAEGITVSPLADVLTTRFSADGGAGGGTRHEGQPGTGVYIINSAGRNVLTVSGDPGNYGSPTPAYGADAYDTGSEIALVAPEEAYVADDNRSRRVASGFTVTNASGTVLAQSAGTSGSFTINEDAWLTWDITALQHAIGVGATVGGAVATNAVGDATSVWQNDGATLSFTAVPDPGYVFRGWFGEVEREWMDSAQIAFEADHGRTITAFFEPAAAGARVWTGEGDGASWLDPANWSPAGLPGIAEAVTIPKGANVTASLCAQLEVGSLTVEYGAALTVRRLLTTRTTRGTLPAGATGLDKLPTSLLVNGDLVVGGTLTMGFRNSYSQFDLAVAGNLVVETNATVNLYAGYAALKDTSPDGWAEGGGRVHVRGAMTIADKASVKPYCDCIWGAPVVFEVGSARIDAGGSVNAYAAGWALTYINAIAYSGSPNRRDWRTGGYAGGTYAGIGGYSDTHTPSSTTYGSPYAPYMPGSPGMNSDSFYGGGAIRIHAEGDFVLDGTLNANGYYPSNAGSGGSIWITAGRYRSGANAVVTAAGGDRTGNSGAGGGGRICLAQGLTDEQIGQLYETGTCDKFAKLTAVNLMNAEAERPARLGGTITARGGTNPRTTYDRRYYGTDGTAVWLAAQPAGTMLIVQ